VVSKTKPFDPADYLTTDAAVAAYLSEAMQTGDSAFIADALGVVARARGMTRVAREAGVARESLYRALDKAGNPELATVVRVINAIGLRLDVKPAQNAANKPPRKPLSAKASKPRDAA
jgi:probable addiction module antidote protein